MLVVPINRRRLNRQSRRLGEAKLLRSDRAEEYTITLGFGSPQQQCHLIIDTGSADLWVTGTSFHKSNSASLTEDGAAWLLEYASGGVSGALVRDTVVVSTSSGLLKVPSMPFGVATRSWTGHQVIEDDSPQQDEGIFGVLKVDGVLGLGFRSINSIHRDKGATFLDHLSSNGIIESQEFSLHLSDVDGFIVFGPLDTANLTGNFGGDGNMSFSPVARSGFWLAEASVRLPSSFSNISSRDQPAICGRDCYVMVDSGSSFVGVPQQLFSTFVGAVTAGHQCSPLNSHGEAIETGGEAGLIVCRCATEYMERFPVIRFGLNTWGAQNKGHLSEVYLEPSDYLLPLARQSAHDHMQCLLAIRSVAAPQGEPPTFVLGTSLFRAYLVNFDVARRRIGFLRRSRPPLLEWPLSEPLADTNAHLSPTRPEPTFPAAIVGVICLLLGASWCVWRARSAASARAALEGGGDGGGTYELVRAQAPGDGAHQGSAGDTAGVLHASSR